MHVGVCMLYVKYMLKNMFLLRWNSKARYDALEI